MEALLESWPLVVVLVSAFVIGWGAETAQTFISRALALSILAWLQTLPEFAVEAAIAWRQERDLMIANLTGSLRLLVGLGWPMIFFTHFFFQGVQKKRVIRQIILGREDAISVVFLFLSILYFLLVYLKASLSIWDSVFLTIIYFVYLFILLKMPVHEEGEIEELPWIGKKIILCKPRGRVFWTTMLFVAGGVALYASVEPFIHTLQKWSVGLGISTFVFIQWVAPFLSEFPEKISAFNWARQPGKAQMAVMNMVNSNINQWTMLAAMIPIVFSISLGTVAAVELDSMHRAELALTLVQSLLGGILLLDLSFSLWEAALLFTLWLAQFVNSHWREEITWFYLAWVGYELLKWAYLIAVKRQLPRALIVLGDIRRRGLKAGVQGEI